MNRSRIKHPALFCLRTKLKPFITPALEFEVYEELEDKAADKENPDLEELKEKERTEEKHIFINTPNQPGRKLVHNRIFYKELFPRFYTPQPRRGQRLLQAHCLACNY